MSGLLLPPPFQRFTNQHDAIVYTVKKSNIPVTLRIRDQTRLITFKKVEHATTIASSFEAHYVFTKLWPDMTSDNFQLSKGPFVAPAMLDIFQENFEDLKEYCALWNIGLLLIEDLNIYESSLLFNGHLFSFDVNKNDYITHLDNIFSSDE